MERKQKIQELLNRLEDLEAQNPVGSVERLLKDEEEKTRAQVGISGTTSALKVLAKGVEKVQGIQDTKKLRADVEEMDARNQANLEEVTNVFSEQITALMGELRATSERGEQMTKAEIQSIIERFAEYQGTYESQTKNLATMDSLLESEVNRLSQEVEVIYGRLAEIPDYTPSIQRVETNNTETIIKSQEETTRAIKEAEERVGARVVQMFQNHGGGMNRNIAIGGNTSVLSRYTDINLKAGSNVTITYAYNDTTKYTDVTVAASGGQAGSVTGIIRSINNISTSQAAGNTNGTDYVYIASAGVKVTLPDAAANINLYTVKNTSTSSVMIDTTSAQTIDGSANLILPVQYTSVDLISNGSNWDIT